jgi:hypothetical protein
MSRPNKWEGSRYICLVRQSNDDDGDDSVKAQLACLHAACDADRMVYVDKIELEGVTGSLPARRQHFDDLIKRKIDHDDFETLVIQRLDRATRGGGDYGIWLETQLKMHGIRVRFVGDDVPTGAYSTMIKAAKYEAAKEAAMATSQRTAQGQRFAKENGTLKTTGQTPYGCWRIYYSAHGKLSYIIRNCSNGLQERLHVETLEVLDTYGTTGPKSYGRHKKQKWEVALLRPGDADQIRIVRVMFFLWFRWGWGGKRIASLLNKRRVPSPAGKKWSQRQVESIIENEAYTGRTINGESYQGIYNRQKKNKGFEAIDRDELEILNRKTMPKTYNPMEEWEFVDQPLMTDFLPPHIRRMAMAYHAKLWAKRTDPQRGKWKPKKTKYPKSAYWLSGHIFAKQDGEPLVGHPASSRGVPVLYYRHKGMIRGYQEGSVFNRMIRLEPLHAEFCRFLAEVVSNAPDIRQRLTSLIEEQRQHAKNTDQSLEALLAEREDIRERTAWIVRQSKKFREDAEGELQRLEVRRDELDEQIAQRQSAHQPMNESTEMIVERAMARLQRLAEELPKLPSPTMRELVRIFFPKVEADLLTKGVDVSVALPSYILSPRKRHGEKGELDQSDLVAMCLGTSSRSPVSSETHRPIPLFGATCQYQHLHGSNKPVCYRCTRTQRAA